MNKTLITPADGQAGVGESVQYNLQVVNSGSTVQLTSEGGTFTIASGLNIHGGGATVGAAGTGTGTGTTTTGCAVFAPPA